MSNPLKGRPFTAFPYFFVGTFIEARGGYDHGRSGSDPFPYFFVGTFIEASGAPGSFRGEPGFPYFFVGTFIEAEFRVRLKLAIKHFPTFS